MGHAKRHNRGSQLRLLTKIHKPLPKRTEIKAVLTNTVNDLQQRKTERGSSCRDLEFCEQCSLRECQ